MPAEEKWSADKTSQELRNCPMLGKPPAKKCFFLEEKKLSQMWVGGVADSQTGPNKNTKCPIDAHCHRHCRRDPRIGRFWSGLQVASDSVPNPADHQVASAPVQYGFIMTQSDEPNNNGVPVTSPSLPAPVKRRGRKKDSLELKAIKAQIKNDEKQKAVQRIKELKKRWGEETESDVKFWGEIWNHDISLPALRGLY